MCTVREWVFFIILFSSFLLIPLSPAIAADDTVITGRVVHIDGDLFRYVSQKKDWVGMIKDAPFYMDDIFISGNSSMTEMNIANGTQMRLGENTQIQVLSVARDISQIDMPAGMARFYSKGPETIIKVTTRSGYVIAFPGSIFDFYVGENSIELIGLKGRLIFVHTKTGIRYETVDAILSLTANEHTVSLSRERADAEWEKRNKTRERFWAVKSKIKGRSFRNLPPQLRSESYILEENGKWESIEYDGSLRWLWRPTRVFAGWSPFTRGRWTKWKGDQVWIPTESFGYLTHHYGSWVFVKNRWYWLPPLENIQGKNLRNIVTAWHPGRVRWIYNRKYVGWIPLAPYERSFTVFSWGGTLNTSVRVKTGKDNTGIMSCTYARNAVIIMREFLHRVNSYKNNRLMKTDLRAVVRSYTSAAILDNAVLDEHASIEQYSFTSRPIRNKPHFLSLLRAEKDKYPFRNIKSLSAAAVKEEIANIRQQKPDRSTYIEKPKTVSYIVPSADMDRPRREVKLELKEIRKPAIRFEIIPDTARPSFASSLSARQQEAASTRASLNRNAGNESLSPATNPAENAVLPRQSALDNFEKTLGTGIEYEPPS
ncbi:MAG TPA: DUF6600 domain-containing protein [Syntrophorhabdaceae bacterium]|nr:DUF6600 domain-containing protein [Syntrophorhabdaceae bacterium]